MNATIIARYEWKYTHSYRVIERGYTFSRAELISRSLGYQYENHISNLPSKMG